MKQRNTQPPTEAQVRKHFEGLIPNDAKLMQPDHTTIWALDDGTLLWDWKGGFAQLTETGIVPKTECLIYLTGRQASGKSTLISSMSNAVEVNFRDVNLLYKDTFSGYKVVAVTSNYTHPVDLSDIKDFAKERNIKFIKLSIE